MLRFVSLTNVYLLYMCMQSQAKEFFIIQKSTNTFLVYNKKSAELFYRHTQSNVYTINFGEIQI